MQHILLSTLGSTISITPLINSITTLSSSVYNLIGHLKITKNTHYTELMKMLAKTDIEATIVLLQTIILDISELPSSVYFTNKFIPIALSNVKESITLIDQELHTIKEKIQYNNTIYLLANMRSHDLLPNIETIENNITVLDRRCEYLFKCLDLCKHFAHTETPSMEGRDAVLSDTI